MPREDSTTCPVDLREAEKCTSTVSPSCAAVPAALPATDGKRSTNTRSKGGSLRGGAAGPGVAEEEEDEAEEEE